MCVVKAREEGDAKMRIAIVDDLTDDLKALECDITRWAQENRIALAPPPALFDSGEAFLEKFQKGLYDIIFLDIYMNGITGMDTARHIRTLDQDCRLIFITSTIEFAVDSYEVDSSYYLVKPYPYEKLCQALMRCSASLLENSQSLLVPVKNGSVRLFLHSISYTECINRKILVHQKDGTELTITVSQKKLAEALLAYPYFCDCYRGILVNLESVSRLLSDGFLLDSGQTIPISRLKYREVREQFLQFSYAVTRGGMIHP